MTLQMDHPNHGEEENDHSWGMYMAPLTAVAKLQLGGQRHESRRRWYIQAR